MSSNASSTSKTSSPLKQSYESSESFVNLSKKSSPTKKSFLSMLQSSNSKRQNSVSQSSNESTLAGHSTQNSSSKLKYQEGANLLYNSTEISDARKMVVSFQTGNSGSNSQITDSSILRKTSNKGLTFISANGSTQTVSKPAAGKVLKNGASNTASTKGGDLSKKKVIKGLENTSNGTSSNHSHQDNHRGSHSAPNSRNNSGGSNSTANKKEILDMEHSSVSTDSSTHSSNSTASKLSKIGRRLRDSCRNLRGKHSSGGSSSHEPQDYTSIQAPNESLRSKNYVPMDFSGREGRICDLSDLPGNQPTKEGYTYFRRKCLSGNVKNLLTETQSSIHKTQPWFHKGIGRDASQRILATHATDGAFLVRESSVSGGFVISYYCGGRTHHAQALPDVVDGCVTYSIDDCKTRFFDLLQMVEFYQINRGSLSTRLTHYIVSLESAMTNKDNLCERKPTSRSNHENNTTTNISENHQDLNSIANQAVKPLAPSEAQSSSGRQEKDGYIHKNGRFQLPVKESNLPLELNASLTSPERTRKCTLECNEQEEQVSQVNISNSSLYYQESDKLVGADTMEFENKTSRDLATNQNKRPQTIPTPKFTSSTSNDIAMNGSTGVSLEGNNICDLYSSTNGSNDESNNNNNNNIKKAKKSQLITNGENLSDRRTASIEEKIEEEIDESAEAQMSEETKNHAYKNDNQCISHESDHFGLIECEKEKHPTNNE